MSTLEKGSKVWKHRRIQRRQEAAGVPCSIFASQNPVLLSSGRVLAPVTLNYRGSSSNSVRRWNACFYTDDGGATWACSNPISSVDDAEAQWDPFFFEQNDGKLRAFMRNFTKGIPQGTQWRLTTVGTGVAKGTPVRFPDDPVYSFMKTVNCRPQIFRLAGGRYCLLQQDAAVNHRDYSTRLNVALHFGRSGADFSVVVDGQPAKTFPNPLVNPTPRLYLGDGFEVDYVYSLSGSEFLVDLGSLQSQIRKKAAQTAAAAATPCSSLTAAELLQVPEDTPYRKACRRSWAKSIEKVYLVSPLICPKCRFPMKNIAFIEDPTVVRKILQHLGLWETHQRPPPKRIVSSPLTEPMEAGYSAWAPGPVCSYDDPDQVYPD